MPILLIFTTLFIFILIHLAPGDPVQIMLGGNPTVTKEVIDILTRKYGLDKPLWMQYLIWLGNVLRGDFGHSFVLNAPVITLIGERILNTLKLTLTAQILAICIALLLGIIAAKRHGTLIDNIISALSLFGYSMPSFWLGLICIFIFSLTLGWLPSSGTQTLGVNLSPWEALIDELKHMIMPVTILALNQSTFLFRLVRSSMIEALSQDYITAARARGVSERLVVYKHALKNALLPVVTAAGLNFGYLLSGAVLIESVFGWPGLGRFTVQLAFRRDYPALLGIYLLIAITVMVANLITDILYAYIDPRVKYGD